MSKRIWIYLLVLTLLLAACAPAASRSDVTDTQKQSGPQAPAPAQPLLGEQSTGSYAAPGQGAGGQAAEIQRLVIMNAELSLVVPDPGASLDFISNMAKEMGGYVVTSNLYKTTTDNGNEIPAAKVTVRVPVDKLNDALTRIKGQVKDPNQDIKYENVTGQDVTKEYTDSQSQLTSLQAKEKQLQEIMASTTKTEDVLSVFRELTATQQQIEVLKGQIKYYEESAAMSAITVNLASLASVRPLTIGNWQPVGVARDAIQALINALKFLGNAAIWLGLFCLPIGLLLGVPAYFIWRGFRRWQKGRKAAQPTPRVPPAPAQ